MHICVACSTLLPRTPFCAANPPEAQIKCFKITIVLLSKSWFVCFKSAWGVKRFVTISRVSPSQFWVGVFNSREMHRREVGPRRIRAAFSFDEFGPFWNNAKLKTWIFTRKKTNNKELLLLWFCLNYWEKAGVASAKSENQIKLFNYLLWRRRSPQKHFHFYFPPCFRKIHFFLDDKSKLLNCLLCHKKDCSSWCVLYFLC